MAWTPEEANTTSASHRSAHEFKYGGGETFTFTGDDDLWVFINASWAIDLGGLHPEVSKTITLDASAACWGSPRAAPIRWTCFTPNDTPTPSNFRVDTNFTFVNCGVIIP